MNEVVRDFILETNENLAQLDLDLVTLERDPTDRDTLARVFRTIHTVKGTSGFLGFSKLEAVTHAGENLLSRIRAGTLPFTPESATALLGTVDAIRKIVASIEQAQNEGDADFRPLIQTLERLTNAPPATTAPTSVATPRPAPVSAPAPTPSPPTILRPPIAPITPPPIAPPPPVAPPLPKVAPVAAPPPAPTPSAPAPRPISPTIVSEPAEPAEPRVAAPAAVSDSAIRVDVGLLDKLMTLVGELVLARNQIVQYGNSQEDAGFLATVQRLNLLTTELQTGVMKTRMQPIGNIWSKFPRVVRDLAVACGKQARIDMEGKETDLDKTIVEAIRDPLTHLIRNAVDHGLETPDERIAAGKPAEGRLSLHARHEGGKVIVEIADDGRGIDPRRVRDKALANKLITPEQAERFSEAELIDLVFLPGFSTTERVTQFSGRGVGMDVVRTNVEKIGGSVSIESHVGRGTTVQMKIPLTLAIIPALTVSSGGDRYAIPQVNLLELVRLEGEQARKGIERIHGTPVYRLRGNLLPLVYLHRLLQVEATRPKDGQVEEVNIVVLQADEQQFGLVVDAIHDTEEIVVKPLQKQLKGLNVFAGVTIMGDGKLALILDVVGLAQSADVVSAVRERGLAEKQQSAELAAQRQTVLLFTVPGGARMAIPLTQVARLEEFARSSLEKVGRNDVIQYRDEILPLFHVSRELKRLQQPDAVRSAVKRLAEKRHREEKIPVVVYSAHGKQAGLVVGQILDIVEADLSTRSRANRPGVLWTAVVQDRVTEFLDVEGVIRSADAGFFEGQLIGAGGQR